jgi:hypothetical protein
MLLALYGIDLKIQLTPLVESNSVILINMVLFSLKNALVFNPIILSPTSSRVTHC